MHANSTVSSGSYGYGTSASIVKVPPPRGHVLVQESQRVEREQEIRQLEHRLQAQAKEISALTEGMMHKDEAAAQLRRQLQEFREEMLLDRQVRVEDGMRKELSSLHSELEEKRKAIESLELATDASRAIADLGSDRARLQQEAAHLAQNKAKFEEESRYWEHEARTAKYNHDLLAKEVATLKNHNITMANGLQQQVASKVRDVEQRCKTEEHNKVLTLERQIHQLQHSLEDKESELRVRSAGEASAMKEVDGLRAQNKELMKYNEELKKLLDTAGHDVEASKQVMQDIGHKLEVSTAKESDMQQEMQMYKAEMGSKMRQDIESIVKAAEMEHNALRAKLKRADEKITKLKKNLSGCEEREEMGRGALERERRDAKLREEELMNATTETREDLSMKLAATENELYTLKAAYAEAKTTALMQYFNERGELEKELSGRVHIMAEEVRSCVRLVRKMLERFTSNVEPPPGEADDKLITLKQLLLLLQSHSSTIIDDPPIMGHALAAWEQRGDEILKGKVKPAAQHHQPFLSSITAQTISTTTTTSD
eukprot:TRINITY_DN4883_c1_g1_i1.p1 TRINITY_DN4883_c1_g1~~TRINITY_DN4883_c1_g1_i1.p1  ORF type:complete len:543 (+),score=186.77 TRINITY_DN4883_c1_g1_i1:42-1670(+)